MSSSLLITLEMAGVLGVVLAFGFWELWSLRRDKVRGKARDKAEEATEKTSGRPADGP
jgi:hypothetical protein